MLTLISTSNSEFSPWTGTGKESTASTYVTSGAILLLVTVYGPLVLCQNALENMCGMHYQINQKIESVFIDAGNR